MPLFGHLKDKSLYVVNAITPSNVTREELSDETQRICDCQPYFALFRVAEREISDDNNLNKNITSLIGKTLSEFKTLKNPEVCCCCQSKVYTF